jgi:outer membrane protein insertion porin family
VLRLAFLVILAIPFRYAEAQHGFVPVSSETAVSGVGFFGNRTFPNTALSSEIVTEAPGWLEPILFWRNRDFTFNPVELQKDVHRLKRFYRRQGFLEVDIDYRSELDSLKNRIDISFLIKEGEPLILQSVDFIGPDGRQATHSIMESRRRSWNRAREDNTTWRIGRRPSIPELVRVQSEMNAWMRDNGYAFSSVGLDLDTDSVMKLVDVSFQVRPGPVTRIDSIEVDWLDDEPLFDDHIILRQLPLQSGDLFSQREITRGQRGLFNLNVFRFALIDVPTQRSDSTVDLRIRVQRGNLNVIRALTGYGLEDGFEISGEYTRRNFLGSARRLTISGILNTEIGERVSGDLSTTSRRRLAVSIFQPYFLRRSLSGLLAIFYDRLIDRAAQEEEVGGAFDLLYELAEFRTLTTGISISRVRPLLPDPDEDSEPFIRGVLASNAVIGRTDDHIAPTEGFLIRPTFELGTPLLLSEVEYVKLGLSGTVYQPIGRLGGLAVRGFRGRLWPTGDTTEDEALVSERFDRTRFYAGGADDVRGWAPQLLGPKEVEIVDADTVWNPLGRLDKWLGNVAYRFPLPITPPEMQWAVFADAAKLGDDSFRVGAGLGVRYRTPVGFIRLDMAYKLNPSPEDLRDARDVARAGGDLESVPEDNSRRLRLHFGIGQAF